MNNNKSARRHLPDADAVIRQATSLIEKGGLFTVLGDNNAALASYDRAIETCRPLSGKVDKVAVLLSQALDNKGSVLLDLGRPADTILAFEQAIHIYSDNVRGEGNDYDAQEIAISIMNCGRAYMLLGRFDEAKEYLERAVTAFDAIGSPENLALAIVNLGDLYFHQGDLKESLTMLQRSVEIWESISPFWPDTHKYEFAYALFAKADVLFRLGFYDEALESLGRCAKILGAIVEITNQTSDRHDLADAMELRDKILAKVNG
ncbi:MAG TPA: tetratricopeptide repeat protein [Verrucomicrobiae bacterium]